MQGKCLGITECLKQEMNISEVNKHNSSLKIKMNNRFSTFRGTLKSYNIFN